jgi:hypothetical protein
MLLYSTTLTESRYFTQTITETIVKSETVTLPTTVIAPTTQTMTQTLTVTKTVTVSGQTTPVNCDPSYPDVCIPPPPPDLDCSDIPYRNFRVLPPDPHHFDVDGDGIGCET